MEKLELPEIEVLRRDLERETVGRKVKAVEAVSLASMPTHETAESFEDPIVGSKVVAVDRVGLWILVRMDNDHALAMMFVEGGTIAKVAAKEPKADGTVAVISFTQGGDLRITDPDGNANVAIMPNDELGRIVPAPSELGLDLHAQPISWVDFGHYLKNRKVPLKLLLTDEAMFVGIGDVYSNEILFDSGLRHDRMSSDLSTQEIRRLYRSLVGTVHEAIKAGGTSLEDRPFVDLAGTVGEYASQLLVYGRAGEPSPRSRTPIKKTSFKHQVVYFCNTQV